jgi:hypothetical protein
MPYNPAIPGQVSKFQLRAIEIVAALVPPNGTVVEVGSLFGSSSWAWAKSVDPSVTVHCIDPWEGNEGVRTLEARHGVSYGLEQFRRHTADCPNIRAHQGYSPADFRDWALPVDLYYEDAVHTDPILAENLDMWSSRLTPAGIVCGDDYRPRFPDVMAGASRLARRLERELIRVDFFWCLLPPDALLPGAARAAQALRQLGAESDAARRAAGPALSCGPLQPLTMVAPGDTPRLTCRVFNAGLDPWPATGGALAVGVRLVAEEGAPKVLAAARVPLPVDRLLPDLPCDVTLPFPAAGLEPGRYRAVFDVIGPDGEWPNRRDPRPAGLAFGVKPRAEGAPPPASPRLKPGVLLSFALGGSAEPFKRAGWVGAEAKHCWMLGPESALSITPDLTPRERAGAGLRLKLRLRPFIVPGRLERQRLAIAVNGRDLLETALTEPGEVACDIPAALAFAPTGLEIRLRHPDAARPADLLAGSADRKALSFAVTEAWIELLPA